VSGLKVRRGVEMRKEIQRSVWRGCERGRPFEA